MKKMEFQVTEGFQAGDLGSTGRAADVANTPVKTLQHHLLVQLASVPGKKGVDLGVVADVGVQLPPEYPVTLVAFVIEERTLFCAKETIPVHGQLGDSDPARAPLAKSGGGGLRRGWGWELSLNGSRL